MLNVSRLLEELRFVTIHPDKHNQELWAKAVTEAQIPEGDAWYEITPPRPSACGSFGCLAGNTAVHEPGVELDWYEAETYRSDGGRSIFVWQADYILNECVTVPDWDGNGKHKEPKSISEKARELLGLTPFQAHRLFDGDNTLDRLWELAEQFSGGEIIANPVNRWSQKSYGKALKDAEEAK